jgi:Fur family peroxide stress response transcriptional regulator
MNRDPAALARMVDSMLGRCRDAGLNVTPQRVAIYRALLEAADHPTPEMLYRRVRSAMPSLSLATVYKVLEALAELGVVQEIAVRNDSKRYDANMERHHHLVCSKCKKTTDLYDDELDAVAAPRSLKGFRAEAVSVQITGLCAACAPPKAKAR